MEQFVLGWYYRHPLEWRISILLTDETATSGEYDEQLYGTYIVQSSGHMCMIHVTTQVH